MSKQKFVIDAPSNLGLKPPELNRVPGTCHAPAALRAEGIISRMNAGDAGSITAPTYSFEPAGEDGVLNADTIASYSKKLARAVGDLVDDKDFPLVLGGDCSILLGSMLALRVRGRYGLIFVDGHTDLQTPQTSVTGGAAGMDLALALGHGPKLLTDLKGLCPFVREEDVVAFGFRDHSEKDNLLAKPALYDLSEIREIGIQAATKNALKALSLNELDGIWLHVDVDVLDSILMPAVDSPQPDGFTYGKLRTVIQTVLSQGLCVGMQVTTFDPDLDPEGQYANKLTTMLVDSFDEAGKIKPSRK